MEEKIKEIISRLCEFHKNNQNEFIGYGIKYDDLLIAAYSFELISKEEYIQIRRSRIYL